MVVEVIERRPPHSRERAADEDEHGWRGIHGHALELVQALAASWGVTHWHGAASAWFRLGGGPGGDGGAPDAVRPRPPAHASTNPPAAAAATDPETTPVSAREAAARAGAGPGPLAAAVRPGAGPAGTSFLAEAGELLAGQLDVHMVSAAAGQILVPRLADWCGVWLIGDRGRMRLAHVWHRDERGIGALRRVLQGDRPPARLSTTGIPWPWPEGLEEAGDNGAGGSAVVFPLVAGGRCHGAVMLGRAAPGRPADGGERLAEDVVRQVAQALVTAHSYTRQATISRTLQRSQLPSSLADIPGVETAIIYEPYGEGQTVGGDFYDVFPIGDRRWCFLLGDVCGHDLEAMSVTGLARHLVRLLAREGHGPAALLGRLNAAMADESAEAVSVGGEQAGQRFLSLLYGELEPDPATGTARCTLASAGHPLPLLLSGDGTVRPGADPQMLLGIDDRASFHANSLDLAPGEILLCVTDGVTERRQGDRQLDDEDGLAEVLRGCAGLGAKAVADRVRQAAHDFSTDPIDDDLAVLVLEATPVLRAGGPAHGRGHARGRSSS